MSGTDEEELMKLCSPDMSPRSDSPPPVQRRGGDQGMEAWLSRVQRLSPSSPPRELPAESTQTAPSTPPSSTSSRSSSVVLLEELLAQNLSPPPSPSPSTAMTVSPSPPKARRFHSDSPTKRTRRGSLGPGPSRRRVNSGRGPQVWNSSKKKNNSPRSSSQSLLLSSQSPPAGSSKILFARPASSGPQPGSSRGPQILHSNDPIIELGLRIMDHMGQQPQRPITPDPEGSDGSNSSTSGIDIQRILLKACSRNKPKNVVTEDTPTNKSPAEAEGSPKSSPRVKFVSEDLRELRRAERKAMETRSRDEGREDRKPVRVESFGPSWSAADKEAWLKSLREIDPCCSRSAKAMPKGCWTPAHLRPGADIRGKRSSNSSDTSTDLISSATDDSLSKDRDRRNNRKDDDGNTKRSSF